MNNYFERLLPIIGTEGLTKLQTSHVVVVGLGGVGGAAVEVLARCGVGKLTLIDFDIVQSSNTNRQIIALTSTHNQLKTEVFKNRVQDINPKAEVILNSVKLTTDNIASVILNDLDYLIDAIDSLDAKCALIKYCQEKNIPFISSMGMALKTDLTQIKIIKMNQTTTDPLARMLRNRLRSEEVSLHFWVVASTEKPREKREGILGSYMPVTFTAGVVAADFVLKQLTK